MRLAVISSAFPCGTGEPYLAAELAALHEHVSYLAVAPLRPERGVTRDACGATAVVQFPLDLVTLGRAAAAFRRAPRACFTALAEIIMAPRSVVAKIKNVAIFPRALALAERFHAERIDHVHAYWLSTPATAAYVVARVNRIRWSATAHRWDIFENNMIAEKAAASSFVRAISEAGRERLVALAPKSAEKFVLVRLGTALARSARARASRGSVRLLCAAAFVPTKGHDDLITAFARAHAVEPALHLTLAGTGPLEARIRARVATLPCRSAVAFRGYVEHERLLRELREDYYDAVILASRDDGVREMEGVPSILIEAASLGIACIATRSGSVGELLDADCAFTAPPNQPHLLSRAILDAVDVGERRARADRACERAQRLHDPERNAAQFAGLLAGPVGGTA